MQGICSDNGFTGLEVDITKVDNIGSISNDGTNFVITMKDGTEKIGSTTTKGCSKEDLQRIHHWFTSALSSYQRHQES